MNEYERYIHENGNAKFLRHENTYINKPSSVSRITTKT